MLVFSPNVLGFLSKNTNNLRGYPRSPKAACGQKKRIYWDNLGVVAPRTPGHTKGCTTWTLKVKDGGKMLDVVIVGSPNVNPGYVLVGNKKYPEIAQDFEKTFRVLKALPVDVFLGAHGAYYNLDAKYPKMKAGGANPFIDPAGYKAYIAERETAFRTELARQKGGPSALKLNDDEEST